MSYRPRKATRSDGTGRPACRKSLKYSPLRRRSGCCISSGDGACRRQGGEQRMKRPDFAQVGPPALEAQDLLFLFEHFPVPGVDAVEAARRVHEHWNTLDSLLESDFVF